MKKERLTERGLTVYDTVMFVDCKRCCAAYVAFNTRHLTDMFVDWVMDGFDGPLVVPGFLIVIVAEIPCKQH